MRKRVISLFMVGLCLCLSNASAFAACMGVVEYQLGDDLSDYPLRVEDYSKCDGKELRELDTILGFHLGKAIKNLDSEKKWNIGYAVNLAKLANARAALTAVQIELQKRK